MITDHHNRLHVISQFHIKRQSMYIQPKLSFNETRIKTFRMIDLYNLKRIHLSQNEFDGGTLPDVVYKMTQLKDLRLWRCGLHDLGPR